MIDPSMSIRALASIAPVLAGALAVAGAATAGCGRRALSARERVLAGLPGDVIAAGAADGRALSHPLIRGALDAVAARWPASLGCVIDAAAAADAVGVGVDRAGNATVLIAAPVRPRCPALSQREPGLWIATLGAGPSTAATSVLDDPRFDRARPYLVGAPIAAAVLGDVHALAAAQPDPLDAWLTVDAAPGGTPAGGGPNASDAFEAMVRAVALRTDRIAHLPESAAVGARLVTQRSAPSQFVVRLTGPVDGDLGAAMRVVLATDDAPPAPRPVADAFTCPPPAVGARCLGGTSYGVAPLSTGLAPILTVGQPTPVVVDSGVAGMRLAAPIPTLGLEAGDVIVAMSGRLVSSRTMLADWIAHASVVTTFTVRRGGTEAVLDYAER